jgi:hypothetical protein
VLDVFVLANLRLPMQIAFDAALHVRNELERPTELFFLLLAMRTPPCSVHLYAARSQTTREGVVLMLVAIVEIVGQSGHGHDEDRADRDEAPVPVRSPNPEFFLLPFPALLRHKVFISRLLNCRDGASAVSDRNRNTTGGFSTENRFSNDDSKHRRQHIDRPALQCQHLAVHHHIDWPRQLKLDAAHRVPLRQRMARVRSIIKCRQIPD